MNKPAVILNLILKIQSLFPEKCGLCDQSYAADHGEKPLLECARCCQTAHAPCLAVKCGFSEQDVPNLTAEAIQEAINPCKLPGVSYMCPPCYAAVVPDQKEEVVKKSGRKKTEATTKDAAQKGKKSTVNVVSAPDASVDDGVTGTSGCVVVDPTAPADGHQSDDDDDDEEDSSLARTAPRARIPRKSGDGSPKLPGKIADDPPPASKPVCSWYKKGSCRYGASGKGCPFNHPPMCKTLLRHGNRGANGCKKGSKCEHFHPKMCQQSMQTHQCTTPDCKLRHVTGTQRNHKVDAGLPATKPAPCTSKSVVDKKSDDFLDKALNSLETRIMAAIERKFETLQQFSQQPQQCTTAPPSHNPQWPAAPLPAHPRQTQACPCHNQVPGQQQVAAVQQG